MDISHAILIRLESLVCTVKNFMFESAIATEWALTDMAIVLQSYYIITLFVFEWFLFLMTATMIWFISCFILEFLISFVTVSANSVIDI